MHSQRFGLFPEYLRSLLDPLRSLASPISNFAAVDGVTSFQADASTGAPLLVAGVPSAVVSTGAATVATATILRALSLAMVALVHLLQVLLSVRTIFWSDRTVDASKSVPGGALIALVLGTMLLSGTVSDWLA